MRGTPGKALGLFSFLTLAVAAVLGFLPGEAKAQSSWYPKRVPLKVIRQSAGVDNPFSGATATVLGANPPPYAQFNSDGNHNAANLGVAVGMQDTAIVDIRDHWLHGVGAFRAMPNALPSGGGTATGTVAADSSWFGDFKLTSNSATIDSITIFRDYSPDGVTWTVVDSTGSHLVCGQTPITLSALVDSMRWTPTVLAASSGNTATVLQLEIYAIPWMNVLQVTDQAVSGVNFIRWRWHMTAGDFAAAGTSKYLRAEFVYPAVDSNPNAPNRVTSDFNL